EYTPLVEPLSLDEAYLDVTDYLRGEMTAWATAKDIRKRIHDETALTASAGISYNKFLAKLALDHQKPNGQFAIMPDEGEAFVANLAVARFRRARCTCFASKRARTYAVRPSTSFATISARSNTLLQHSRSSISQRHLAPHGR